MNKKKHLRSVDKFSEHKVIEYVAGFLDEEDRLKFEKELDSNQALKRAVESERQLRAALTDLDNRGTDTSGNFTSEGIDKLFEKIDRADQDLTVSNNIRSISPSLIPTRSWFSLTAIAASVVFGAVIFVNFEPDQQAENFALLSDESTATEFDFNQLIKQQKVAQIWLTSELSSKELSNLFSDNGLTPISRAGQAWVVASSKALSSEDIENLETLAALKKVSLISYDFKIDTPNE